MHKDKNLMLAGSDWKNSYQQHTISTKNKRTTKNENCRDIKYSNLSSNIFCIENQNKTPYNKDIEKLMPQEKIINKGRINTFGKKQNQLSS